MNQLADPARVSAYDFLSPPRIAFGWGRRRELGTLVQPLGRRAAVVCSRRLAAAVLGAELRQSLGDAGVAVEMLTSDSREPTIDDVDRLVASLRKLAAAGTHVVVAVGGGSMIDLAKAAAGLVAAEDFSTVRDFLEGVGRGLTIRRPGLPLVAVPTTAGTGSETTKNAVISCPAPPSKKSLRSDWLMARLVLVDPELTTSLPPDVTAQTGMDAITQLIESYISRRARSIPQALASDGLRRALLALPVAFRDGADRAAREAMAHAALLSGLALANSGLGMAHGVAAALGAHCGVPHGLACAVMLPAALRYNLPACERQLAELGEAAGYFGGSEAARAEEFVAAIETLCAELGIPSRLSALGACREQLPELVAGSHGNSLDGNPRPIDDATLTRILEDLW